MCNIEFNALNLNIITDVFVMFNSYIHISSTYLKILLFILFAVDSLDSLPPFKLPGKQNLMHRIQSSYIHITSTSLHVFYISLFHCSGLSRLTPAIPAPRKHLACQTRHPSQIQKGVLSQPARRPQEARPARSTGHPIGGTRCHATPSGVAECIGAPHEMAEDSASAVVDSRCA